MRFAVYVESNSKMDIEKIQAICRLLPRVTEDIKWGNDLVFSIGGKMFCVIGLDHIPVRASFKVSDEEFEEMCIRPGFKPAPYVAKYHWVMIEDIGRMKTTEWNHYLQQSYTLVKEKLSKKIRLKFGMD